MSFLNPSWHYLKSKRIELLSETKSSDLDLNNNFEIYHENFDHVKHISHRKQGNSKRQKVIWINVISIFIIHILTAYCFIVYTLKAKLLTVIWGVTVGGIGGFGITAGVHRLWAHRSYKATVPLKLLLLMCYSIAGQNDVYEWVRDHRTHHRFSETDADPHNSNRGIFFAHVGWLLQKKHPEVSRKGKLIDMSDIAEDPLIIFHTKYFLLFKILFCFVIPVLIPRYCWNESWLVSFVSQDIIRYVANLNFTWSVNSLAHAWGKRPYNKDIKPCQNIAVAIMAMGEGWHNYHHVFPWDYKAAELGDYTFNVTTFWLDLFAKIGWAYDLKTPSQELINLVAERSGDGTHITEVPYDHDLQNLKKKITEMQKCNK